MFIPTPSPPKGRDEVTNFTPIPGEGLGWGIFSFHPGGYIDPPLREADNPNHNS